jgi:hypothetical protein
MKRYEISAIDPFDKAGKKRRVIQAQIEFIMKSGLEHRFYRLRLIKEVGENPTAIYQGWNRLGYEESLCYVGRPRIDFPSDGIELPRPPGKVFAVFVTASGKCEDWRWEPCDPKNPELIENHDTRFGKKIWP